MVKNAWAPDPSSDSSELQKHNETQTDSELIHFNRFSLFLTAGRAGGLLRATARHIRTNRPIVMAIGGMSLNQPVVMAISGMSLNRPVLMAISGMSLNRPVLVANSGMSLNRPAVRPNINVPICGQ